MANFEAGNMAIHKDDIRPMLVVAVDGEKVSCKFPGKKAVKVYPASELTLYKPSGPMRPVF